jgi:N-methylhydantoinase A
MAAEASRVLARRGVDAPTFRMVAFGGAGPLMAALLADEIGIEAILIPPVPGALSALGAARADIEGDLVQPVYARLHAVPAEVLIQRYRDLDAEARKWAAEQTARLPVRAVRFEYAADMRYEGQGYDVTVPFETDWLEQGDVDAIAAAFHAVHRDVYGHANEQAEVWMKELRAHIIGAMPKTRVVAVQDEAAVREPTVRPIRLFGRVVEARIVGRAALADGHVLDGPAIVNQMDTTTLIPAGWRARIVRSGAMVLERAP